MTPPAAVGAAIGLLSSRNVRRLLIAVAVTCGAVVLFPLLLIAAVIPGGDGARPAGAAALPGPAKPWLGVVNAAAAAYHVNPFLLLAILGEETGFGTHPDTYRANFLGCCFGPFQLNVADGTWASVRLAYRRGSRPVEYPRRVSPHPSVYDSFDAAAAAAALLRGKVGGRPLRQLDATAWQAARAYQGAGPIASAYADRVLARARAWSTSASDPTATGPGRLAWPVRGPVTSPFGPRWGRLHAGIDIAAPAGTPITAADAGRVLVRGSISGYGQMTCLAHADELVTCYAHQSRFAAKITPGSAVTRGQVIGFVGCTGHCQGDHLHFEVRLATIPGASTPVDPMPYLESGRR